MSCKQFFASLLRVLNLQSYSSEPIVLKLAGTVLDISPHNCLGHISRFLPRGAGEASPSKISDCERGCKMLKSLCVRGWLDHVLVVDNSSLEMKIQLITDLVGDVGS